MFSSVELSVFKVVHPSFLRSPLSYHSLLFISSFQTGAMSASVFFLSFCGEFLVQAPTTSLGEPVQRKVSLWNVFLWPASPNPRSRKFSTRHPEIQKILQGDPEIQQSQSRNPEIQTIRKPVKSLVSLSFPSPGSPETNLHEPQADGKQAPRSKKKRKKTIFCNFLLHLQASMGWCAHPELTPCCSIIVLTY